jgi:signal transduction histidine kinase
MLGRLLRRGRSEDRERGEHLLQTLRDEIERINGLLEEYLKILRPRHRRDQVFDINRTVEDAIRFVEPKATGAGVVIVRALSAELPQACADEEALRQVLLNILINAIEAMPDGGRVEVSTGRRADGAVLRVRDTGPGLAHEIRERVFQPFVSTKRDGTGLGLAISQRLTGEMDGEIVVSSESGEGACFEVILPAERLR